MDGISDIYIKINKLVIPKFPQIKNVNVTCEHRPGVILRPWVTTHGTEYEDILVFDVQFDENMKFIPNLLTDIGNTIFLLIKMIYPNDYIKTRVNFNSLIAQSSFINY
jgi:hypothetical protein